jgi:putative transposase
MTDHLGHGKNQVVASEAGNTRNGRSKKTLKGEFDELPIEIPRDRAGTFEPQIIAKHKTAGAVLTTRFCRCTHVT